MSKSVKFFMLLLLLITIRPTYAVETPAASSDDDSARMQEIFDEEQHEDYILYKNEQNNLADNKREKALYKNQYWLVNKKQDLWLGIFDGKQVIVPGRYYYLVSEETYPRQQVIRVKNKNKISQFLLTDFMRDGTEYPPRCSSKLDYILKDSADYLLFFSGCTFETLQLNSPRHDGRFDIFLYDKTYDSLMKVDAFPYSASKNEPLPLDYGLFINKVKNYYINTSTESPWAFKFTGKDQVIQVDPKTGKKIVPDAVPPTFLKRFPEVTINN